jgi:hypothetical protein
VSPEFQRPAERIATATTSAFADPKRQSYTTKPAPAPVEIDEHSQVGRKDREPASTGPAKDVLIHSA